MRKFFFLIFALLFIETSVVLGKDISPVILGLSTYPVTEEEKAYVKQVNPYGFVFVEEHFKKNINFPALKEELTQLLGHKIYFFVDQEGGKVNRLRHIFPNIDFPSAEYYGSIAEKQGIEAAKQLVFEKAKEIALLFSLLDIDVNLAPNAEIRPQGNFETFFKNRLYSRNPETVKILSEAFAEGTKAGGIEPCFKHFPGTALSETDPHKTIPVISTVDLKILTKREFVPFASVNKYKYIMMGHALYPNIDDKNVSTLSPKFYKILRKKLKFKGFIITDSLNMSATGSISIGEKIARSLSAGADLALFFFPNNTPFEERLKELEKIPPQMIKRFNKKLQKMNNKI